MAVERLWYSTCIVDRWVWFFKALHQKFGFTPCTIENIEGLPKDVEIVLLCVSPKEVNSDALLYRIKRNPNVKLITYVYDIHAHGRQFGKLLEESDVILSTTDESFREKWPQAVNKFAFFPMFFAPHERYSRFSFNKQPIMKCLLAGMVWDCCSLREALVAQAKSEKYSALFSILPCHGTQGGLAKNAVKKDAFARQLHAYFCAATSTVFKCVIAKHFEIPATGSLLLTNKVKDLDALGFIPFEHYIPITHENAVERIAECLANPHRYEAIRRRGMDFVRTYHSINNRLEQLKKILE